MIIITIRCNQKCFKRLLDVKICTSHNVTMRTLEDVGSTHQLRNCSVKSSARLRHCRALGALLEDCYFVKDGQKPSPISIICVLKRWRIQNFMAETGNKFAIGILAFTHRLRPHLATSKSFQSFARTNLTVCQIRIKCTPGVKLLPKCMLFRTSKW